EGKQSTEGHSPGGSGFPATHHRALPGGGARLRRVRYEHPYRAAPAGRGAGDQCECCGAGDCRHVRSQPRAAGRHPRAAGAAGRRLPL
ncbi:MAG: hypothetical protein AVDCRST_MAG77-5548, partial [uncultured Chloroflexi bacterium]